MFFWQFTHNVTWHTVMERFCSNLLLTKRSLVSLDNLLISGKHFQSNVEVKDQVMLKYYLLLEAKLKVVSLHNNLNECNTTLESERVSGQRFLNLHLSKGHFHVFSSPTSQHSVWTVSLDALYIPFLRTEQQLYNIIRSKSN